MTVWQHTPRPFRFSDQMLPAAHPLRLAGDSATLPEGEREESRGFERPWPRRMRCAGMPSSGCITHGTSAAGGPRLSLSISLRRQGLIKALLRRQTYREPARHIYARNEERSQSPLSSLFLFKSKTEIQCTGHGAQLSFTGFLRAENEI